MTIICSRIMFSSCKRSMKCWSYFHSLLHTKQHPLHSEDLHEGHRCHLSMPRHPWYSRMMCLTFPVWNRSFGKHASISFGTSVGHLRQVFHLQSVTKILSQNLGQKIQWEAEIFLSTNIHELAYANVASVPHFKKKCWLKQELGEGGLVHSSPCQTKK